MPAVVLRDSNELRPCPGTIHTYPLRVRTKMTPPGQAIATMSTGDVPLAHYQIAFAKAFHVFTHTVYNAHKLVADGHRHGNRFLRPRIPVINVYVGPADGRFQHANEHVIATNFWNRNFLEPQTGFSLGLHDGLHRLLHNGKLGQSGKQEKSFASGTKSFPLLECKTIDVPVSSATDTWRCHAIVTFCW